MSLRPRFAVLIAACCLGVSVFAAAPASPKPAGILELAATPLGIDTRLPADQLAWLNQVFDLMGSSDFTFIHRTDTNHWMGLYRERLSMVLNIHDGSAGFDFRALVDRSSGRLTVIRATAWEGMTRMESAKASAAQAVGYLERVLNNPAIYGAKAAAAASSTASPDHGDAAAIPASPTMRRPAGSDDPLTRLLDGNARFAAGKGVNPNQDPARRAEVAGKQKPFAIVLTCSDSRLPPEILFDTGLGDIFVVRTAGEVAGEFEIGSIEYAAEHLHATHLMILGHERCGAVDATIKGGEVPDNIARIALQIQPAVALVRARGGDLLDNAIRQHALNVRDKVLRSPVLAGMMHEGELSVSVAYYDLDTGKVSLITEGAKADDGHGAMPAAAPATGGHSAAPAASGGH